MAGNHEELKRALRAARNRAGIPSDQELALLSGVHVQTIQNWMYGNTTPRPSELSKVAKVLDVPMADLMAIYEGRQVEPPPVQDAIRELVDELKKDREAIYTMIEMLVRRDQPERRPKDETGILSVPKSRGQHHVRKP